MHIIWFHQKLVPITLTSIFTARNIKNVVAHIHICIILDRSATENFNLTRDDAEKKIVRVTFRSLGRFIE